MLRSGSSFTPTSGRWAGSGSSEARQPKSEPETTKTETTKTEKQMKRIKNLDAQNTDKRTMSLIIIKKWRFKSIS
jgi:hypothetical protein